MRSSTGQLVHLMVFEWSEQHLGGERGLGPVFSSMSGPETTRWSTMLGNLIWLPEGDRASSTCYLRFNDTAALLYREPAVDPLMRESTRTLALVGPVAMISLDLAAALITRPPGQADDPGPWKEFPDSWVPIDVGQARLRAEAQGADDELIRLMATTLRHMGRSFVITDHEARLPVLLWAASQCLGSQCLWTFSTGETNLAASGLPRFVATVRTGKRLRSGVGHNRAVVDLSKLEYEDQAMASARLALKAWRQRSEL